MSKRVERICKWCGHKVTFDVEKHDKKIYNKAIDDLSNILKENYDYLPQILSQEAFDGYIDEYAEQLKAGGNNA